MKSSSTRKNARVAKQAMQIATLAPVVASARIARVAATGNYGALAQMGTEKASTFNSAIVGLMFASAANVAKLTLATASAWSPWGGSARQRFARLQSTFADATADVARSALTPIRKRVIANSKRLGR